jgi:hypothetical protein
MVDIYRFADAARMTARPSLTARQHGESERPATSVQAG